MPKPTRAVGGTPDASADASDSRTLLIAVLAGLVAIVALLLVGRTIVAYLFARLVSSASLLRSKGLNSGPFPFAGHWTDGRGRATGWRNPSNSAGPTASQNGPGIPTLGAAPELGRRTEPEDNHRPTKPIPLVAPQLTDRELAVLRLAAEGFTNAQIGARLYLSRHTVKEHLSHAMRKLGATNRLKAVREAISLGLLEETGSGAEARHDPDRLADNGRAEANSSLRAQGSSGKGARLSP